MAKLGDYVRIYKDCNKCGYKIGRLSERSERRCWKCGNIHVERDFSEKALKVNQINFTNRRINNEKRSLRTIKCT